MSRLHRTYFNNIAGHWNEMVPVKTNTSQYLADFGICAGESVLDVGAGTGRLTTQIEKKVGRNGMVVAIDIADEMLQHIIPSENCFRLCADIGLPPLKQNLFDKIICFSTFPHIKNKQHVMSQFYYVLKPEGKLLIFHTQCSSKLNLFHHQLNIVVCNDLLPRADKLSEMARLCDFLPIKIIEKPDLYWVELSKPEYSRLSSN